MQIKAVTFDVGGTLIEPWPSVGHVYAEVAARHGTEWFSAEELNARFKAAWRARQNFGHSRDEWAQLVEEVFRGAAPNPSGKDFFPELYDQFARPEAWHIFEDVLPALDALASRGIKLAVISNWDERLRGLLKSFELDRYFETVAISCEVGFAKPSPAIFERAALKLGLPAREILHVGDSWEMDVQGARAAGFQAVQIHRAAGNKPEDSIQSLIELPEKIKSLNLAIRLDKTIPSLD
ncbi:MAG TPA: HAD-IA family hydrolase [Candidatus Angelobacter sp.]|nr:HAD-IA family hydrolase [Candidatus Angelobacter sp.]